MECINRLVAAIFVIYVQFLFTTALKCFICHSHKQPDCIAVPGMTYVAETGPKGACQYCIESTYEVSGKTQLVQRTCISSKTIKTPCTYQKIGSLNIRYCECSKNYCNGPDPSVTTTTITMLSTITQKGVTGNENEQTIKPAATTTLRTLTPPARSITKCYLCSPEPNNDCRDPVRNAVRSPSQATTIKCHPCKDVDSCTTCATVTFGGQGNSTVFAKLNICMKQPTDKEPCAMTKLGQSRWQSVAVYCICSTNDCKPWTTPYTGLSTTKGAAVTLIQNQRSTTDSTTATAAQTTSLQLNNISCYMCNSMIDLECLKEVPTKKFIDSSSLKSKCRICTILTYSIRKEIVMARSCRSSPTLLTASHNPAESYLLCERQQVAGSSSIYCECTTSLCNTGQPKPPQARSTLRPITSTLLKERETPKPDPEQEKGSNTTNIKSEGEGDSNNIIAASFDEDDEGDEWWRNLDGNGIVNPSDNTWRITLLTLIYAVRNILYLH